MLRLQETGSGLRWLRTRKGKSLAMVAAEVGCTETFLSKAERGLAQPDLETLLEILEVLEADWFQLGFAVRVGRGEDHGLSLGETLTDREVFSLAIATFNFQDCSQSIATRLAAADELI